MHIYPVSIKFYASILVISTLLLLLTGCQESISVTSGEEGSTAVSQAGQGGQTHTLDLSRLEEELAHLNESERTAILEQMRAIVDAAANEELSKPGSPLNLEKGSSGATFCATETTPFNFDCSASVEDFGDVVSRNWLVWDVVANQLTNIGTTTGASLNFLLNNPNDVVQIIQVKELDAIGQVVRIQLTPSISFRRPIQPQLISPSLNEVVPNSTIHFDWNESAGLGCVTYANLTYEIRVLPNDPTDPSYQDSNISGSQLTVNPGLPPNSFYRWQVRGINNYGNGTWPNTVTFETGNWNQNGN